MARRTGEKPPFGERLWVKRGAKWRKDRDRRARERQRCEAWRRGRRGRRGGKLLGGDRRGRRRGRRVTEQSEAKRNGATEQEKRRGRDDRGVEAVAGVEGKLRRFEGKSSKLGQRLLITVWGAVPGRRAVPSARV